MTDSHETAFTSIAAEVNGILIPVALVASAARTIVTLTLSGHRPFLNHFEFAIVVGDSHTEVFGSPAGILSASPEAEDRAFAEGHLRRNEIVVRMESTTVVVVALREDQVA